MKKWLVLFLGVSLLATACRSAGDADDAAAEPAEAAVAATQPPAPSPTPQLTEADFIAPTPSGLELQPLLAEANIDLDKVVALLPPDAIPAILPDRAPDLMVTAAEANELGIDPEVRVIGVSLNGESQAFPIPFLSRHEIVNTEIGGRLLAVTW